MALQKLDVFSVRNIHQATLLPSPTLNFITGSNGSGKSALLEAIFILGRARSFRTVNIKQTIAFDQTQLTVAAQSRHSNGPAYYLGIRIDHKKAEIRINGETKQKAELAYCFPVQLIHPKSYRLLDAGPQIRREFLDWGIFNRQPTFLDQWRRYNKALQQRNCLLKSRQLQQLPVWNRELNHYGSLLAQARQDYLQPLAEVFKTIAGDFVPGNELELRFIAGWDRDKNLLQVLQEEMEKDLRYGFTHSGSHRADFQLLFDRRIAKDFISRGQQKLLVLSLILAQVELLNRETGSTVCILIDDLAAELDAENKAKLLKYLFTLNCQVFMSSTDLADFGNLGEFNNYKLFHVEHGRITQQ